MLIKIQANFFDREIAIIFFFFFLRETDRICAQKQQIIIAWYREARGSNQDQSRVINIINYFHKILNNKSIVFTLGKQNFREKKKKIITISL
jgi:archaellum biogenesis ATPase FlaH